MYQKKRGCEKNCRENARKYVLVAVDTNKLKKKLNSNHGYLMWWVYHTVHNK